MPQHNNPEKYTPDLLKCYDVYNNADIGSQEEYTAKVQLDELVARYSEAFERKFNLINGLIKVMPDFPVRAMLNMAYETDTNELVLSTPYVYTLEDGESKLIDTKNIKELTCIYHSVSFITLRNPADTTFQPETGMCLQGFYRIPYNLNDAEHTENIWTVGLAPLGLATLIHPSYKMN